MPVTDLSIALVGMGGFGTVYLRSLLNLDRSSGLRLMCCADPVPSRCEQLHDVQDRRIPIYPSLEELLHKQQPDLIVLATPPQYHADQVILAVQHGCHVLCEKPVACEPQQVRRMIEARDKAGRQVAIGYQWSFSPAILNLKADIMAGRFGKPKKLRTSVYWPRGEHYYSRNDWAGRRHDSQGRLVLDSPVNNACSHFLHNMFFVLGPEMDRSDWPTRLQAELYRANPIDNYDTAVIRCLTRTDAELLFITSHATQTTQEPLIHYQFEKAAVHYGGDTGNEMVAKFTDGTMVRYGEPMEAVSDRKLQEVCTAIRDGRPVACGIEAAAPQNVCMFAAQESMPVITEFSADMVVTEGEPGNRSTYARNLEASLDQCFQQYKLPTELGFSWARAGKMVFPEALH